MTRPLRARRARYARPTERAASCGAARSTRSGGADRRPTSWRSRCSRHAPGGGRSEPGDRRPPRTLRPRSTRRLATSARAACWPGGWSSAACDSSRSTPAAPTTTTTGTLTAIWWTTTRKHAGATDQPIAGLLNDLKQRGLLDETLVVWGGEFGRQPTAEYGVGTGRDHNSYGFTMWMAGGGIKGGVSVGATDEIGSGRGQAVPRQAAARHGAPANGPRSERAVVLLPRTRPETRRRRAGRANQRDHRVGNCQEMHGAWTK